jgi:O-antigen/teichoic acid export membrane protein/glycosyltransferase involved in cell wall biosynthesis
VRVTLPQVEPPIADDRAAPTVSIAIRAYRRRWLGEAIESVLGQTFADLELVVYDDAGDLEDLVGEFDDPRVRYHRAERKMGPSGRYAAALDLCRGRYVGLLDDDDRYGPETLEQLVAALDTDPAVGIAVARCAWELGDTVLEPTDERRAGLVPDAARGLLCGRYSIQPSMMLMRREVRTDVETAQRLVDGIAADLFINVRAGLAGWAHVLVDTDLVVRRWHGDQLGRGAEAHDVAVATWAYLSVDDHELEALRAEQYARALLRRSVSRLANRANADARADLRAAGQADPAAWRRERLLLGAAARSGPLARIAAGAWLRLPSVRRRREHPPNTVRDQRSARSGVGRDSLTLAVGTLLAYMLQVGIGPAITRLFTPAEIGCAAVLIGVLGLWPLACLSLDWAIPLAPDLRAGASICALCLITGAGLAAVSALAVALFGDAFAQTVHIAAVEGWLWLLPLQLALGAIGLTATGVLVREKSFGRLAAVRALQSLGVAVTAVAAGVAGGGGGPLALATTVGGTVYALVATAGAVYGSTSEASARDAFLGARDALRRWGAFGLWGTTASGLTLAREAVVPLLIAALYGPAAAGIVFIAQRVLAAPVGLASETVTRAWYGTAAAIVRDGGSDMRETLKRVTVGLILGGASVLMPVAVAGPALFPIVFGQDFGSGSDVLLALVPLHFMIFVSAPSGIALVALDRRRLQSVFAGTRLAGAVAAIAAGHAFGLSLAPALGVYAASMAVVSAAVAALAWRLSGEADVAAEAAAAYGLASSRSPSCA